jgi:hypothetical protein
VGDKFLIINNTLPVNITVSTVHFHALSNIATLVKYGFSTGKSYYAGYPNDKSDAYEVSTDIGNAVPHWYDTNETAWAVYYQANAASQRKKDPWTLD